MNERAMPNPNCTEQGELSLGVIDFGRLGQREVQSCFDCSSMTRTGVGSRGRQRPHAVPARELDRPVHLHAGPTD